jgi:hypothetical protein
VDSKENPDRLPPEAAEVAKECGYLPLALAMFGAMIRSKPSLEPTSASLAWKDALTRLRRADLGAIKKAFPNYPYPDLLRAIEVSVEGLESVDRERYVDLALFPEDQPLPESGYLADGTTPGPVLTNALTSLTNPSARSWALWGAGAPQQHGHHRVGQTWAVADESSCPQPVDDGKIIADLNAAWKSSHPDDKDLVAFGVDDDGMILWLNDGSIAATEFASNSSWAIPRWASTASLSNLPVFGRCTRRRCGATHRVSESDPRVPDVIGIAQYGVVYTGHKSKIAEHGGDHPEDRNVPILVAWPGATSGLNVTDPVETIQIAPTILQLLGLRPEELQAV